MPVRWGRAAAARAMSPLAGLSQSEIEVLEQRYPQLEDILPLSPLQEGLLFHALYDAQGTDLYTVQLELELAGALDCRTAAGCGRWSCVAARKLAGVLCRRGLEPPGTGDVGRRWGAVA